MTATYRFLSLYPSYAANGDRIVSELPLEGVKWGRTISAAGSLTAKLNVHAPQATMAHLLAGYHQLAVERNGIVVWSGPLWTVQTSLQQSDPDRKSVV